MAELRFPVPPLAGDVVLLRPWREADVPGMVAAFGDPVMQRFSWRTAADAVRLLARWAFAERCGFSREGLLRSHVPFQGARRDSVIYSLLPGELR